MSGNESCLNRMFVKLREICHFWMYYAHIMSTCRRKDGIKIDLKLALDSSG
jgi:hypothetical protein